MPNRELYIAEFDEINLLGKALHKKYREGRITLEKAIEQLEDLFIHAYLFGFQQGIEDMNLNDKEKRMVNKELDENPAMLIECIYCEFEGKDFVDRSIEYLKDKNGANKLQKVIDTEYHRDVNEGIVASGRTFQKRTGELISKTWLTVNDEKVRDWHIQMEGVTIGVDDEFVTPLGNHGLSPGQFGVPDEDCNCRCVAVLKRTRV